MLENGEDILWVSNMLGHTDATMTLSRYARYIKRDERKRAVFLEKSVALNDTETTPKIENQVKSNCFRGLKSNGSGYWIDLNYIHKTT